MPIITPDRPGTSYDDWAGLVVGNAMSKTMTGRSFGAWSGGFGEGDRARKLRRKEERAAKQHRRLEHGNRERAAGPDGADRS